MDLPVVLEELDPLVVVAGLVILVVVVLLAVLATGRRRNNASALEERFGAEYHRAVDDSRSRRKAEHDLTRRAERRREYEVRTLDGGQRDAFRARWVVLQTGFVDGPEFAARAAVELARDVAVARGYPDDSVERCLDDVSVDHPELVADLRRSLAGDGDWTTTEHHREAFVHARALFERLVREGESRGLVTVLDDEPDVVDDDNPEPVTTAG